MAYEIFKWIHIISYITWLLAFVLSLYFALKVFGEDDAVRKRGFMRSERKVTSIGAHIGAVGILLSGGAMVSMGGWGWFPFQAHAWLAVKQLIFILILVLVGLSIKRSVAFKKRLREEKDVPCKETSKKWRLAFRMSLAVYILVVVNTFLGLVRPF